MASSGDSSLADVPSGGNNSNSNSTLRSSGSGISGHGSRSGNTRMAGRGVKRRQPLVLNGLEETAEKKNSDYLCLVCFDLISEAHMTKCGHTFCRVCLERSIETNRRCPKCNFNVDSTDNIFPNHAVNQQILKQRRAMNLE